MAAEDYEDESYGFAIVILEKAIEDSKREGRSFLSAAIHKIELSEKRPSAGVILEILWDLLRFEQKKFVCLFLGAHSPWEDGCVSGAKKSWLLKHIRSRAYEEYEMERREKCEEAEEAYNRVAKLMQPSPYEFEDPAKKRKKKEES